METVASPMIAVVGAGAVGTYYGARLAQAGGRVSLLLRSDFDAVGRSGLQIRSKDGDFALSPRQITLAHRPQDLPGADLVLVALKTTANAELQRLISPLLHDRTLVLTLQNGLGNEEAIARFVPAERVIGGLAFVCINRTGPGQIHHSDHGLIKIGNFASDNTDRLERIAAMFHNARVPCEVLANLRLGRWEKLVWNVPFNGLGAALDLPTDRLLASLEGRDMVAGLMREIVATAQKLGLPLADSMVDFQINRTASMGSYQTSMQLDRRHGRPLENEAIIAKPLAQAKAAGVPTPLLEQLDRLLRMVQPTIPAH